MIFSEVAKAVDELYSRPNVSHLADWELREMAEAYGTITKYGNINFVTSVKNRSAGLTVYLGSPAVTIGDWSKRQKELIETAPATVKKVHDYMKRVPFVCVERTMGDNDIFAPHCTLFVSTHRKDSVRLAYMWGQTFLPFKKTKGPHLRLVYIPEWQEKDRQILVFPEEGITYVLGSDYYGESKKGMLRMGMWCAKQEGLLGLHAGAKILKVKDISGKIRRYGMIIFGLTATGKTTHSCHNHGLSEDGEGIEIVQDDVVFWCKDGAALGTERGWYVKTEGLNPDTQPLLYHAAISRDAILENVMVDYEGGVDFNDDTLTGNGRCIIQRKDIGAEYLSKGINLPPLSELDGLILAFIVRRNTVVSIASKLSPEQAAATFMLGESVESSGSDPRRAGESVREVGTNPFIIGDKGQEGNCFYEFLMAHPGKVLCYLLNTGGVGEISHKDAMGDRIIKQKVTRVEIPEMASIIKGIVKGTIEWEKEPYFNTELPKNVNGVDMNRFSLRRFYSQQEIEEYVKDLRRERIEYLEKFTNLNKKISMAIR